MYGGIKPWPIDNLVLCKECNTIRDVHCYYGGDGVTCLKCRNKKLKDKEVEKQCKT